MGYTAHVHGHRRGRASAARALVGFISPINDPEKPAERLADIFGNPGRYTLTLVCVVGGLMLVVPAVVAVRNLAPVTGRRMAAAGTTIAAGFMLFLTASGASASRPPSGPPCPTHNAASFCPHSPPWMKAKAPLGLGLLAPLLPWPGSAFSPQPSGATPAYADPPWSPCPSGGPCSSSHPSTPQGRSAQ